MKCSLLCAFFGAAFFSAPAEAALQIITYSGVATEGVDQFNSFGTGLTSLVGQPFAISFVFDLERPGIVAGGNPIEGYVIPSDSNNGVPGAIYSASVTINGVTIERDISFSNTLFRLPVIYQDLGSSLILGPGGVDEDYFFVVANSEILNNGPFDRTFGPLTAIGNGSFILRRTVDGTLVESAGITARNIPITVNISNLTSVPEPAEWALLTIGFAMTGFAFRRRKLVRA